MHSAISQAIRSAIRQSIEEKKMQAVLWTPATLFAASEPGVWYDPSDMSTMFQDAAGTTPVTAVEQPVGLILDKSKGLVLGPELVTFASLTPTTEWSYGSNVWTLTNSTTNSQTLAFGGLTAGLWYRIQVTVTSINTGNLTFRHPNSSTLIAGSPTITAPGTYTMYFQASGAFVFLRNSTVGQNVTVSAFSARELPGNHATQTTATSRPVLSARVNLLTATETLATQTVTTRATTQTLRFEGAGTVTLSGTATGTYSAGSHSVTTTAGNLTLTVSGTVTKADLRAANMGVGLPAYQRVDTATDYDTAGFPHYLRFDGVDDWLVTPTITPGTDKAQVFAGVRKLSDAARGVVVELSTSTANDGMFVMDAPNALLQNYSFASKGNAVISVAQTNTGTFIAPITNTITGLGDISADSAILRVNGTQVASSTADQGTGNFLAYPLYIGRRGGTTLPFNGHLYGLIVRFGANLPAGTIASTETWLNQRTGAY